MNLAEWERRVDAAITRIEGDSPSRLRMVPLDMIAEALVQSDHALPGKDERALERELMAMMGRNAFPVPVRIGDRSLM